MNGAAVLWIYSMPTWLFSIVLIGGMSAIAALGHWTVRRVVPARDIIKNNDVAGFILGIIGTAYAVLLSFVVVGVWQQYETSDSVTSSEAAAVSDLHRLADTLPAPLGPKLKKELDRYINVVINDEWPAMQRGAWSAEAQQLSHDVLHQVATFAPGSAAQQVVQAKALDRADAFLDARRQRLHDNETGIPGILWWTLFAFAAITIGFTYLFGLENMRIQILMTVALTAAIALILVLVAELDYPFRGDSGITPHSWYQIQRQMHSDR